ncbi:hypothetical protein [Luteimonas salinilitoris]|uniref:DUF2523 domain-containing protein n=1 Tax=Luteimonas salinilitoris TaxID=3237697 RepID=A0ABV4HVV6_9GAMM
MPLPAYLAVGGLAYILKRVLLWVLLAKGAAIVARILGVLGLAFFTNELVIQPVMNMIQNTAGGIPAELRVWLSALAIDKVISIVCTAYLVLAGKRVLLGRAGA